MASIADLGVKKITHFYDVWPALVIYMYAVTICSLIPVYYESI